MPSEALTAEQMKELGLDPECPFCSERITSYPVDVRYGDDRITRSSSGAISHYFGWYSEHQIRSRAYAARLFGEAVHKAFKGSTLGQLFHE